MAVPTTIADLSTTAASNSPAGTDPIGTTLDDYLRAIQAIIKGENSIGTDIASAGTVTIPNVGHYFVVTGTTGITAINNCWNGRIAFLKFSGAVTLTHSAGLILPNATDITTAAGDTLIVVNESTGVWRCIGSTKGLLPTASSAEMIAGTETALRGMTPALVKSAIKALALTTPTAVSASGTSINFTGITSDVSVIFVGIAGLSTNGTSLPIIQIGDSGGLENTGYLGTNMAAPNGAANAGQNMSSGFGISGTGVVDSIMLNGTLVLYNLPNTYTWSASGVIGDSAAATAVVVGGHKTLSAQLDRLSITTAGGTDAFDSGTVSISYL